MAVNSAAGWRPTILSRQHASTTPSEGEYTAWCVCPHSRRSRWPRHGGTAQRTSVAAGRPVYADGGYRCGRPARRRVVLWHLDTPVDVGICERAWAMS